MAFSKPAQNFQLWTLPTAEQATVLSSQQKEGVEFMNAQIGRGGRGVIVGDEMGVGKTGQAVWMCMRDLVLREDRGGAPSMHLVIGPISVVTQWMTEVPKFLPPQPAVLARPFKVAVYHHTASSAVLPQFPGEVLAADAVIVLTGIQVLVSRVNAAWELLAEAGMEAFRQQPIGNTLGPVFGVGQWDTMVLDEAHVMGRKTALMTQLCLHFSGLSRFVLSMTATPLNQSCNFAMHLAMIHADKSVESLKNLRTALLPRSGQASIRRWQKAMDKALNQMQKHVFEDLWNLNPRMEDSRLGRLLQLARREFGLKLGKRVPVGVEPNPEDAAAVNAAKLSAQTLLGPGRMATPVPAGNDALPWPVSVVLAGGPCCRDREPVNLATHTAMDGHGVLPNFLLRTCGSRSNQPMFGLLMALHGGDREQVKAALHAWVDLELRLHRLEVVASAIVIYGKLLQSDGTGFSMGMSRDSGTLKNDGEPSNGGGGKYSDTEDEDEGLPMVYQAVDKSSRCDFFAGLKEEILANVVLRRTLDVSQLPPIRSIRVQIALSRKQVELLLRTMATLKAAIDEASKDGEKVDGAVVLECLNSSIDANENSWMVGDKFWPDAEAVEAVAATARDIADTQRARFRSAERSAFDPESEPRIQWLLKLLSGATGEIVAGDKVVYFHKHTRALDIAQRAVDRRLPGVHTFRYDGSMTTGERQVALAAFKACKEVCILFMTNCGSVGMNMQFANKMIIEGSGWSANDEAQILGRIFRRGQEREVTVWYVSSVLPTAPSAYLVDAAMEHLQKGKAARSASIVGSIFHVDPKQSGMVLGLLDSNEKLALQAMTHMAEGYGELESYVNKVASGEFNMADCPIPWNQEVLENRRQDLMQRVFQETPEPRSSGSSSGSSSQAIIKRPMSEEPIDLTISDDDDDEDDEDDDEDEDMPVAAAARPSPPKLRRISPTGPAQVRAMGGAMGGASSVVKSQAVAAAAPQHSIFQTESNVDQEELLKHVQYKTSSSGMKLAVIPPDASVHVRDALSAYNWRQLSEFQPAPVKGWN